MPAKRGGSSGYTRERGGSRGINASALKQFNPRGARGLDEGQLKVAYDTRRRAAREISSSGLLSEPNGRKQAIEALERHGARFYLKNSTLSDSMLFGKVMGYI